MDCLYGADVLESKKLIENRQFNVQVGVCQWSVLIPLLFTIVSRIPHSLLAKTMDKLLLKLELQKTGKLVTG